MGSDLTDYLKSLEKVDDISINCLLPGHGKLSRNPYRLFHEAKQYLRKWEGLIIDELRGGPKTLYGITTALFNGCEDPGIRVFNYGMIDTFLRKLRAEGKITTYDNNGDFYSILSD